MVVANIEVRLLDEGIQTIIESVAMNEKLFRGQRSIKPATKISSSGEKQFVIKAREARGKKRNRGVVGEAHLLH